MIIGPGEYSKYKVPCQILMDRVGVNEMDVTQIELCANGDVIITMLCRDTTDTPQFNRGELMTWQVMVP